MSHNLYGTIVVVWLSIDRNYKYFPVDMFNLDCCFQITYKVYNSVSFRTENIYKIYIQSISNVLNVSIQHMVIQCIVSKSILKYAFPGSIHYRIPLLVLAWVYPKEPTSKSIIYWLTG